MNSTDSVFPSISIKSFVIGLAKLTAPVVICMFTLTACNKTDGSRQSGSSATTAPGASSGVEVRTPAAPDSRGGGSSGSKGMPAVTDTSGGPTSGGATSDGSTAKSSGAKAP